MFKIKNTAKCNEPPPPSPYERNTPVYVFLIEKIKLGLLDSNNNIVNIERRKK